MNINTNIQFTKDEQEVMSIIREVIKTYTPMTQAFIVGGWVRDRLMGVACNDIDIMIDNASGADFAKMVTKYLKIDDPHVIRENPEKSRFLETAKCYIKLSSGTVQEVDFAQARVDVYDDKSRIPTIRTATPFMDSFRRDLTINSIFYRLNDNQLIDFTGMGLNDLKNEIIRTPQDPLKTFKDDPLRLLRILRFSSKYGWNIDPQTYNALLNPEIREALKQKVSHERIGMELKKMLAGPNPQKAIELLKQTGLFQDFMTEALSNTPYKGKMSPLDMDQKNPYHKLTVWEHSMEVVNNIISQYQGLEEEKRVIMILFALLHDLGKLFQDIQKPQGEDRISYHGHEDASWEIAVHLLKYLDLQKYIEPVSKMVKNHMRLHSLDRNDAGLKAFRKYIRNCGEESLDWVDMFNFALADAMAKDKSIDQEVAARYKEIEQQLKSALSTMSGISEKDKKVEPILNGNEIMLAFNNNKPGVWIKTVMNWLLDVRDNEPNITKEEAKQRILDNFPEFIKAPKTASKCSKILVDSVRNQVRNVIETKPKEAYSLAMGLLEKSEKEDDDVVLLCMKTAFNSELLGCHVITNDLVKVAEESVKRNFLDPEINCLYSILSLMSGEKFNGQHDKCLKMAIKMSPSKSKMMINDTIKKGNNGNLKNILRGYI